MKAEVQELAKDAGFLVGKFADGTVEFDFAMAVGNGCLVELTKFATLVAAKERERVAAWIEPQRNGVPATGAEFAAAIRTMMPAS